MRILVCAHSAPLPPLDGFRLQVDALVRELQKRHEVFVVAFRMPDQLPSELPREDMRLIEPPPRSWLIDAALLARAIVRRRPLSVDRLAARIRGPLEEEIARFR